MKFKANRACACAGGVWKRMASLSVSLYALLRQGHRFPPSPGPSAWVRAAVTSGFSVCLCGHALPGLGCLVWNEAPSMEGQEMQRAPYGALEGSWLSFERVEHGNSHQHVHSSVTGAHCAFSTKNAALPRPQRTPSDPQFSHYLHNSLSISLQCVCCNHKAEWSHRWA